jgi:arylsulfatase A-like enzyme
MSLFGLKGIVMKNVWVMALLFYLGGTVGAADRPNIVMFLIDDQDKPSIGAYGGETYTPHLDRMARQGMRFDQAYVSSSVCTPSRYSFLTGRYAGSSTSKIYTEATGGVGAQGYPSFNVALEADGMNVGRVLRDAGYATGYTGKFHLTSKEDFPEFFRGKNGIQKFPKDLKDTPETSALFAHNEKVMRKYLQKLGFTWAKHIYPENMQKPYADHNPEWTMQAAFEFIEANREGPFFLQICHTLLHGGEGSWRQSMDKPLVSGAGRLRKLPEVMTPRDELLARVKAAGFDPNSPTAGEAWIDDAMGALLAKLKALGLDDNTLVIYAADHGRDNKASLFSVSGVSVPMIARWPGRIPEGVVCDELVQNIDLAPTFFEIAGAAPPAGYRIDGRSLVPLLDDGRAENWRDHLYFEMGAARAVATKQWKYIAVRYTAEQVADIQRARPEMWPRKMAYIGRLGIGTRGADHEGFWDADQLYRLTADAEERRTLAADPAHAGRLASMKQLLGAHVQRIGSPFGEFLPGSNTTAPGRLNKQIEAVKKMKIEHKTVVIPDGVN